MTYEALLISADTIAALGRFTASPNHAVLLSGAPGTGKKSLAIQLAAQLLHTEPAQLTSRIGYIQIQPEDGTIPIAAIRSLQLSMSRTIPGKQPISRVALLLDAEKMSAGAQNALLKLLEEPPERSVIILTSSVPAKLLPTVLSRVQKIHVQQADAESLTAYFVKRGASEQHVERAFAIAGNNVHDIEVALSDKDNQKNEELELVKTVLTSEPYSRLLLVDSRLKEKESARLFVDLLVKAASSGLYKANDNTKRQRWHRVLAASYIAQSALARNGSVKLIMTELLLAI